MPPDLPRARAPEALLSIVVDNLLDNAVKFTRGDEACVEVSVREIEDRQLEVVVRDNGPGIRPQDYEQIFSGFSQLEDTFTGNVTGIGLGLSTAKRLVESWRGRISVDSKPGKGSAFFFTVPSEHTPAQGAPRQAG
jgi:signal transduction histidine kinase